MTKAAAILAGELHQTSDQGRLFIHNMLVGGGKYLGAVADSAQVEYPAFFPGARANLTEEIETAGTGYRFSTADENPPTVMRGPTGQACALQLWAEDPTPDSLPAGWRYLALLRAGELAKPIPVPPVCGN